MSGENSRKRLRVDRSSQEDNHPESVEPESPTIQDPNVLINRVNVLFQECKRIGLSTKNIDPIYKELSFWSNSRKSLKNSIDDDKIIITLFGAPANGKSSSINYMMCGDFRTPLPNSPNLGEGWTKTPIRCEYQNKFDKCVVEMFVEDNTVRRELVEWSCIKTYLEEANKSNEYDEILVQIPIDKKPKNSLFPDNIQFIDLIGSPETGQPLSVKRNRNSIRKRDIDCVFIMGFRGLCNSDIIRHMWEIDIFTNLKDRIIPKLVIFEISQSIKIIDVDKCRNSLQISLLEAFDFELLAENNRDRIILRKNELPLMHKSLVIPELYKNCEVHYLFVTPEQLVTSDIQNLIQSIVELHRNNNNLKMLEMAMKLLVELKQKVKSKKYGMNNDCLTKGLIKFLYENRTFPRLLNVWKDIIKDSVERIQDYVLNDDIMYPLIENNVESDTDATCRSFEEIEYRISEITEDLVITQATNLLHFISSAKTSIITYFNRSKNSIEQSEIEKVFVDFTEDYFIWRVADIVKRCLGDSISKYLHGKYALVNELDFENVLVSFDDTEKYLFEFIQDLRENIIENTSDTRRTEAVGLAKYEEELDNLTKKIKLLIGEIVSRDDDRDNRYNYFDYRKPQLYSIGNSLKFPDPSQQVTSLSQCFNFRWLKKHKEDLRANDLYAEGSVKSTLVPVQLELTDEFRQDLNQLELDLAVQVKIDRVDKKISFEFDSVKLNSRIEELMVNITEETDGLSTHLYPIFISSRKRRNFKPNLLVKDLTRTGSHLKKFLIFVFIEAGTCKTRTEFENEINYYKELMDNENQFAQVKDIVNPIVLCFLPERNLGIGRKRKIMMLLAESLNLNRFYFCDDDIDTFFQYDSRPHVRQMRTHPLAASKAFSYMSKVLDYAIEDKDVTGESNSCMFNNDQRDDFLSGLRSIQNLDESKTKIKDKIRDILFSKMEAFNKETLLYLLGLIGEPARVLENEVKQHLFKPKSKIIGQIGLWNQSMNSMRSTYTSRLQGNNRTTHLISKIRYQCVLYNMNAIKGIHPVSDSALFENPLTQEERAHLCHVAVNKHLDNRDASRCARLGYKYSDKAHVYYQILNKVTGYLVYYFSFNDQKNQPSKVNADETESYQE